MNSAGSEIWLAVVTCFAAVFTNNILLTTFLGMCPFTSVSREVKTAAGLGAAVVFVMTCTTVLNWLAYRYVLVPLQLEFFRYILFIIIIAAFVQFVEMVIDRYLPRLYYNLGIFLPLITVNCAILGASLFMVIRNYSFIVTIGYGFGSGAGWFLAILAMAGIRQRLSEARVPAGLRGPGITLIIAGIMALAFIGFTGVLN
ncbi:MAG TPA: Rnf-Nqr domain containing protein [Anaerohalosphaeraceae bacterium]|nr:NADH:ubiquinone reductase (Na(+)-transporting) subunit E [Phycisphaerae bacterium]HOK96572.1 Rnf-Nqr domain containing protein [Anaerohalosphaeraceae bacterium]HOL32580.1 Rnf-Nqr domain containing protein [Anaerohalosphaeraceae bacterium]HOM76311.1 Rnf-Nqr domain containing protein [Anaerohalosphaeraceae bacterium]HPC64501.1 Rnf-Nqr domain containing protein [Anaerohalosphaeraceae bacterium]